ncbi:MAG: hypothetical protein J1D89_02720 [Agathobacter sp.]|nr:hypothetical protein [Agathobacter sp.]
MRSRKNSTGKREQVTDVLKGVLAWAVVSVLGFLYWMAVLLLASIFLMNIWKISIERLLTYGICLSIITSVVYAGMRIYRKFH